MVGELLIHTVFFFCFTGSVRIIDPLLAREAVVSFLCFFFLKERRISQAESHYGYSDKPQNRWY